MSSYNTVQRNEMDALVFVFQNELAETVDDGWRGCVDRPGLNVTRKRTPGTDVYRLRMVGDLPYPIEVVDTVVNNVAVRTKWDKGIALIETVETLENGLVVVYMSTHCPPGVTDRDFLHIRVHTTNPENGEIVILDRSVSHPGKPLFRGYIRANTIFSGLVLSKKQLQVGGKTVEGTKYAAISQVDVCGDIPTLLINALSSKATAEWFGNLEKACAAYAAGKL